MCGQWLLLSNTDIYMSDEVNVYFYVIVLFFKCDNNKKKKLFVLLGDC